MSSDAREERTGEVAPPVQPESPQNEERIAVAPLVQQERPKKEQHIAVAPSAQQERPKKEKPRDGLKDELKYVKTLLETEQQKHLKAGAYFEKHYQRWMTLSICIPALLTCCSALADVGHINHDIYDAVVTCLGALTTFITSFLAIKQYQRRMESHQNHVKDLGKQHGKVVKCMGALNIAEGVRNSRNAKHQSFVDKTDEKGWEHFEEACEIAARYPLPKRFQQDSQKDSRCWLRRKLWPKKKEQDASDTGADASTSTVLRNWLRDRQASLPADA